MATAARRTRPVPTAPTPISTSARPSQAVRRHSAPVRTAAKAVAPTHVPLPPPLLVSSSAGPAIPLKDSKAAQNPRFQKVMDKLQKSAAQTKKHPSPQRKAAEAQAAAQPPANEKLAGAQANQVDTMQSAQGKKPEADSFLTLLRAEIARIMPQTLGDTENFMDSEQKGQLKGGMTGNINQQKEDATGDIKAASSQKPDPSTVEGKTVTPLPADEASSAPPAIGAAEAVPTAKPESEVSLQQSKQDTDRRLKDAEVTPGQLQEANDPRFSAVLTMKSAVAKQADSAPQQYRSNEQKTLTQEAARAVADEKQDMAAFQHEKGKSGVAVKLKQLTAKQKDEARRKEVTDTIEKIYDETKQTVETKLASLETDVSAMFDAGIEAAMTKMKASIDKRMNAYKEDRYGGIGGGLLWASDKLLGMPDEVNIFYEDGRKLFMEELDTLVINIAKTVDTRLKEAKDEIARGQKRIKDYVQSLPKDLQAVGKAAEKEVAGRFEELSKGVDEKKNALAQKLAQRYKEATDKANEQLKKMQEENKGLVTKFVEKLGEIIKILREFKERISSMFKQGKDTIMLIVAHPIRFLENLLNAIKLGLNQFVKNIWKHLQVGFMKWLLGSLADAGIELPKDFSLGSILKLVLSVLGLTYPRIRAKAVKLVGETTVKVLETVGDLLYTFVTGGAAALWEKIKEYLSNLKEMVLDEIQNWIVTTVIKAAVTKLVTMFNPIGAILEAILTIYHAVMFFIERINQILDFVQAIINSVYKIAIGDIGSAANWIEQALARSIPVIIGFLARLLGLSGITDKIKSIIQKIQSKVDAAVDKVIAKIVSGIGKLVGKGKAAVGKVVGWWKAKKQFVTKNGEKHTLSFSGEGKSATLMIASKPTSFVEFVGNIKATGEAAAAKKRALAIAKDIDSLKVKEAGAEMQDEKIINHLNALADEIVLFVLDSPKNPPSVIKYGPLTADGGGTLMDATILSENTPKGSPPLDDPLIWKKAQRRNNVKMVRGHLLNELLGGPGRAYNLTPITNTANGAHLRSTEKFIKDIIKEGGAVRYRVEVIYKDKGSQKVAPSAGKTKAQKLLEAREYEQRYLALGLQISWSKLMYKGGTWVDDPKGPSNSLSVLNKMPDDNNIDV